MSKKNGDGNKEWFDPHVTMDWHKDMPEAERRQRALKTHKGDPLRAAQALQALANVTQDDDTARAASRDAKYFFKMNADRPIKGTRGRDRGERRPRGKRHSTFRHGKLMTSRGRIIKVHRGTVI